MRTRVGATVLLSVAFAACTYVMPTPASPTCGDGVPGDEELCDDGNDIEGDGCDSNCTPSGCGNGVKGGTEECDDGNAVDGDGCDTTCVIVACGDKQVQTGETCDDGNRVDGDGCDSNCTKTACGNGIRTGAEECDDGNVADWDGCNPTCQIVICGDGKIQPGEFCDDGNDDNGDSCEPSCLLSNTTSIFIGINGVSGYTDGDPGMATLSDKPVMTIHERTLYFSGDNTIRMANLDSGKVTTIAGFGNNGGLVDHADGSQARLGDPEGLATDGMTLWFSDRWNNVLRSVDLAAPYAVKTLAGAPLQPGENPSSVPGFGSNVRFDELRGLAYHDGLVYLLDGQAALLQSFNPLTNEVKTIAGVAYQREVKDGLGPDARFQGPRLMRSDGAGKLYISDASGHAIRVYDIATNMLSTLVGTSCGYSDGDATTAQLHFPRGIAVVGPSVYFAEPFGQTIRQVLVQTKSVSTLSGLLNPCAGDCNCGNNTVGGYMEGTGAAAQWNEPWDIVFDPDTRSLLVSDSENFVIRRIK